MDMADKLCSRLLTDSMHAASGKGHAQTALVNGRDLAHGLCVKLSPMHA